jgi:hypothetical protein
VHLHRNHSQPTDESPQLVPEESAGKELREVDQLKFNSSSGERFTLSALCTPSKIVYLYPKLVSREVSDEIEFRLDHKRLTISKQVSNELSATKGRCPFSSAP